MSTTKERLKKLILDSKKRQEEKSLKDESKFVELEDNIKDAVKAIDSLEFMDKETVSVFVESLENHDKELKIQKLRLDSADKGLSESNAHLNSLEAAFISKALVIYSPIDSQFKNLPVCEHVPSGDSWDNTFFELTQKEMSSDGNYLCECPGEYPERAFDADEQTKHTGCALKSCSYDGEGYKLSYYGEVCTIQAPSFD